jgi:peroxiredoxin
MRIGVLQPLIAFGICFGSPSSVASDKYPTTGTVHNKLETSALNHDCSLQGQVLECDFTQMSVRQKKKPEDWPKEKAKAQQEYSSSKGLSKQECQGYEQFLSALKTGRAPKGKDQKEFERSLALLQPEEKQDQQSIISSMTDYCNRPTESNFLRMVQAMFDKNTRTCSVSVNRFSQRFNKLPGTDTWVVVDTPTGPCGVVQLDRFVADKSDSNIVFWNYFAKKAVTNKTGELLTGMKCSDLDEQGYEYNWLPREVRLDCDYISFGLF